VVTGIEPTTSGWLDRSDNQALLNFVTEASSFDLNYQYLMYPYLAYLSFTSDRSALLEEEIDDLLVSRPCGTVQRGQSVPGFCVEHRLCIYQHIHHCQFAPFTCHVERCYIMLK